jgi:Activator of Hsp90 ATPase homolog 1-like protein
MNDSALKSDTQDIVVEEVFPHTPETIWKTLTTGELIRRWMMAPTGFEPVEGARFTFQTTPAGAWDDQQRRAQFRRKISRAAGGAARHLHNRERSGALQGASTGRPPGPCGLRRRRSHRWVEADRRGPGRPRRRAGG